MPENHLDYLLCELWQTIAAVTVGRSDRDQVSVYNMPSEISLVEIISTVLLLFKV